MSPLSAPPETPHHHFATICFQSDGVLPSPTKQARCILGSPSICPSFPQCQFHFLLVFIKFVMTFHLRGLNMKVLHPGGKKKSLSFLKNNSDHVTPQDASMAMGQIQLFPQVFKTLHNLASSYPLSLTFPSQYSTLLATWPQLTISAPLLNLVPQFGMPSSSLPNKLKHFQIFLNATFMRSSWIP